MLIGVAAAGQVGPPPEPPLTQVSAPASPGGVSPSPDGLQSSTAGEATRATAKTAPSPLPAAKPVRVRIPDIDVDQSVVPATVDETGELEAPSGDQAHLAAWYDGSPRPGELGPAVIEGHVTWHSKPSVFFELGGVKPGTRVSVDRVDGTTAVFEVYQVQRYAKSAFPTSTVYSDTDAPELRLITCAGDVDPTGRHHDNAVVYARLVGS